MAASTAASRPRLRAVLRGVVCMFYLAAGVAHLANPDPFMQIVPVMVPAPRLVVVFTGLCEIAGALALLTKRMRKPAGWALAAYALCVWPANFHHAFGGVVLPPIPDSWWYHAPRLAFQPVIIWAALYAGECIDWPWRRRAAPDAAESRSQ